MTRNTKLAALERRDQRQSYLAVGGTDRWQ